MIAAGLPIYVALEPVDMRYGSERLGMLVRERMRQEPRTRALFVFVSKRGPCSGYSSSGTWSPWSESFGKRVRAILVSAAPFPSMLPICVPLVAHGDRRQRDRNAADHKDSLHSGSGPSPAPDLQVVQEHQYGCRVEVAELELRLLS